jgi:hypothetical protein
VEGDTCPHRWRVSRTQPVPLKCGDLLRQSHGVALGKVNQLSTSLKISGWNGKTLGLVMSCKSSGNLLGRGSLASNEGVRPILEASRERLERTGPIKEVTHCTEHTSVLGRLFWLEMFWNLYITGGFSSCDCILIMRYCILISANLQDRFPLD